jgi:hypothetical protein
LSPDQPFDEALPFPVKTPPTAMGPNLSADGKELFLAIPTETAPYSHDLWRCRRFDSQVSSAANSPKSPNMDP